mgnify:CR=1 FL=1
MAGCDDVFYCVVDTRAWLRDPAPLFRTNVEGLRHVLGRCGGRRPEALRLHQHHRNHRHTSGRPAGNRGAIASNWADKGGGYIRSRVEAENLVMRCARERGLPAVALCVSNTYGPRDWQPTPHGRLLARDGSGQVLPSTSRARTGEVVGIEDAATALLLAAERVEMASGTSFPSAT